MTYVIPPRAASLIGLVLSPREKGRLLCQLNVWIDQSGLEWTCNRLKAYHTASLQMRAGNYRLARVTLRENGIGFTGSDGRIVVKGLWNKILLNFVRGENPSTIRRWHSLLRIYTLLRLDRLSDHQLRKAKASIGNCASTSDGTKSIISAILLEEFVSKSGIEVKNLIQPNLSRLNPFTSTHSSVGRGEFRDVCNLKYGKHTLSLLTSVWIPDALKGENPCELLRSTLIDSGAEHEIAGHIAFLQEGGCKARVIAVPNVWCQWLMEPLHDALNRIIRKDRYSCVFDQNAGAYFLQSALQEGKEIFSYDLSSATDRFPLALQQAFLRGIGLTTYANAIQGISEGKWDTGDGNIIQYRTGQPMGLYGSFPLFHLTHVWWLRYLSESLGIPTAHGSAPFRVLGDDVIITDKRLAQLYHFTLSGMGVPISLPKSLKSSVVGQFAGFTGIRTSSRAIVYRPFKWNLEKGRHNVTNVSYAFGNATKKLQGQWVNAYLDLAMTWHLRNPDLSPLFNDEEEQASPDSGLDSYFLGSLVTKLSYMLPYALNSEFHRLWFTQVYLLLGQEEILNDDPGFDLTSDPRAGGWAIQDRNRNFKARGALEVPEIRYENEFDQVGKDPVVQYSRTRQSSVDDAVEQLRKDAELLSTKT